MVPLERILFVSVENSVRSQLAEALLRLQASDRYTAFSAGISPKPIDEQSLACLRSFGCATELLYSKPIEDFSGQHFDLVISLCDEVERESKRLPDAVAYLTWHFEDPRKEDLPDAFSRCMHALNERIKMFILIDEKLWAKQS